MKRYYVYIENDKIIACGTSGAICDGQIEVSEEIYNQLTNLPADYAVDGEDNIISVTPAPEPEPGLQLPTMEERLEALEAAMLGLILGGVE